MEPREERAAPSVRRESSWLEDELGPHWLDDEGKLNVKLRELNGGYCDEKAMSP